jgi:DNA-binding NarL/FixJ family response regulator
MRPDRKPLERRLIMQGIRPRILIADDHTLIAELCKRLLETEFEVVGTVADGRALVRAAAELKPDVIVVDVAMPVLNGIDAACQVQQELRAVKVIYLTMNPDPKLAAQAFRRGASGYLLKTCATSEMVAAVRTVLQGRSYMSASSSRNDMTGLRGRPSKVVEEEDKLTDRQREVLQLLAEGKIMKEVGAILNMTPRTVAFHKYRIMEALCVNSNADLVRYAIRNHMVAA